MKRCRKLKTLLLAIAMLISIMPVNAFAQKGPYADPTKGNSYVHIEDNTTGDIKYVYNGGNKCNKIKGISYSVKTNTLTLNNFKKSNISIYAGNMGENFKINVKGTNKISSVSHLGGRGFGAGIRFSGKGTIDINEAKANKLAIYAGSIGGKNSVVIDKTVTLKAYSPEGYFVLGLMETTLDPDKALSFNADNEVECVEKNLKDGTDRAWFPVSKGKYVNTEKYYAAKLKKNNKKCYIRMTKVGKKTYYWIMTKWVKDSKLGVVANIHTNTTVCESKKQLNDLCKVDYSKKIKGYLVDILYESDFYSKDGTGKYMIRSNREENSIDVYEVSTKKMFGYETGRLVESLEGTEKETILAEAGYENIMTDTKVYDIVVKDSLEIKGNNSTK